MKCENKLIKSNKEMLNEVAFQAKNWLLGGRRCGNIFLIRR